MQRKRKPAATDARPDTPPAFTGFGPTAFQFFKDLATHQDRDWFAVNKHVYDDKVLAPMTALVNDLGDALRLRGIPLQSDAKKAIFRIYRDLRFSKDKIPYKTHIAAALTRDGQRMSPGVVYLHIEPAGCFAACGFYQPEPEMLAEIRSVIASHGHDLLSRLAEVEAAGYTLEPDDSALKRLPRGFDAVTNPALQDLLRRKSLVYALPLTQAALKKSSVVTTIAEFVCATFPLLQFGWDAVDSKSAI